MPDYVVLEQVNDQPSGRTGARGNDLPRSVRSSLGGKKIRRTYVLGALLVLSYAAFPTLEPGALDHRSLVSTRVLARDGTLLYEQRSESGGYARWVELDAISDDVIAATIASEDQHFYSHPGIDASGIARAVWLNVQAGRVAYGGSTLTQQLAKLLDPQPRTFSGKLVEAFDALRLERTLEKDRILTEYLNRAYYGRLAYGIEAAAQRFFGTSASELTLGQATLLAILPRGPTAYDPGENPARARRRRRHVLTLMVERGVIDSASADRAAIEPIELVDPTQRPRAEHVLDHLRATNAIPVGAPELQTTVDLALQERLERRLNAHLDAVADRAVTQAGILVLDNVTAEVIAMVGSRAYDEREASGAVNATTAARHPGSALKPFVYALAFENGADPASPVLDVRTEWTDYHPRSLDGRYRGVVSMRDALGSSMNVPAVRVAERVGVPELAHMLRGAGLTTIEGDGERYGLALALGAAPVRLYDLAGAYSMLARGGVHLSPTLLRQDQPREGRRVLSAGSAYLVTDVLADARARRPEFGFETPLEFAFDVAVKTGTSHAFCDNVVVGYTPEVTVAVWVGNFDGAPMHGVLSMEGAAPLFRDAMLAVMEGRPRRSFMRPGTVRDTLVCPLSGRPIGPHCPHQRRSVTTGAHGRTCDWHRSDGLSIPSQPSDAWSEPRGGSTAEPAAEITILAPAPDARILLDPLLSDEAQRIALRAAPARFDGSEIRFEVDGELVAVTGEPFEVFWTPTPGAHRLRAVVVDGAERRSAEINFTVQQNR